MPQVGGAALNELSYQQARNYGMPVGGVYVAHPGYIGHQARLQKGSIIMAVNGTPTPTLRDFVSAIAAVPHGEQVAVRFFDLGARAHIQLASFRMDRKWFGTRAGHRNSVGDWQTAPLEEAAWLGAVAPATLAKRSDILPAGSVSAVSISGTAAAASTATPDSSAAAAATAETDSPTASSASTGRTDSQASSVTAPAPDPAAAHPTLSVVAGTGGMSSAGGSGAATGAAAPSSSREGASNEAVGAIRYALVSVDFLRPFCIDGETGMRYRGSGLVIDAGRGLVAVDRNTVTSTLGDVSITIGGRITVPGTVEYVHPVHNFALVRYDPQAVPEDVLVRSAPLTPRPLRPGSEVTLVGLKSGLNEVCATLREPPLACAVAGVTMHHLYVAAAGL